MSFIEDNSTIELNDLFESCEYAQCGKMYFERLLWSESVEAAVEEETEEAEDTNYGKHAKKVNLAELKKDDYYRVLGLDDLKWRATEEQIKVAYRQLVLKYHPDKIAKPTEDDRQIFLHIQDAYDVLGNIEKRRAYDSTDCDLTIPRFDEGEDFFEAYGKAFYEYSRFSSIQPAPLLGDLSTPWETVDAFYRFWRSFKSWRVYSYYDEYNPEEATSRGEKRWMNQMNEANRKKLRSQDMKKLLLLVDRSWKLDPRVENHRVEEEKKRKEKERLSEEKKRMEEEKKERERAELERKEKERREEEERKRRMIAEERQRERKEKKRIIKESMEKNTLYTVDDYKRLVDTVEWEVFTRIESLDSKQREEAIAKLIEDQKREDREKAVELERIRTEQEEKKKQEDKEALEKSKEKKSGVEWQLEEDHCLSQAIKKYPAGYRNRWVKIAEFVTEYSRCNRERNDVQCHARSEEIMKKNMGQDTKVDTNGAFARFQRNQTTFKEKNKVDITLDTRYDTAPVPVTPSEEKPDENGWTQTQQKALESALQKYPASMDKAERWKAIADAVDGKNKNECIKRVKWIREHIAKKG